MHTLPIHFLLLIWRGVQVSKNFLQPDLSEKYLAQIHHRNPVHWLFAANHELKYGPIQGWGFNLGVLVYLRMRFYLGMRFYLMMRFFLQVRVYIKWSFTWGSSPGCSAGSLGWVCESEDAHTFCQRPRSSHCHHWHTPLSALCNLYAHTENPIIHLTRQPYCPSYKTYTYRKPCYPSWKTYTEISYPSF